MAIRSFAGAEVCRPLTLGLDRLAVRTASAGPKSAAAAVRPARGARGAGAASRLPAAPASVPKRAAESGPGP